MSFRDRLNSFLGGVLYPEGLCDFEQELVETVDECVRLATALELERDDNRKLRHHNAELRLLVAHALRRERETRDLLIQRNRDLEAKHRQLIDLTDIVDLRSNDDVERWFGGAS
jgi:hypothetical protein